MNNTYFGTPWNPNIAALEQVPTPIGKPCLYCHELIVAADQGIMMPVFDVGERPVHVECLIRMTVGSVGHQRGTCSCHGGTEEDPPGLTRREAARAAMDYCGLKAAASEREQP